MLSYLYKKTNKYKARFLEAEKFVSGVPYHLQIGCFGSSYARFDFDFTDQMINGFNFGVFPQPLHYDAMLLRHYIDHFEKNAYVIFTFPALVFALDYYENDTTNYKYYKFLDKKEILNYSWKTKLFEIDFPILRHPSYIKRIWKDDPEIYNRRYWETQESLGDEAFAEQEAKNRVEGWCSQFGLENLREPVVSEEIERTFDKNKRILLEMVELCETHSLRPVFLIPPVADCLKKYISKEFLQAFVYDNLYSVQRDTVLVLDYYDVPEFGDYRLYSNADFMNGRGRRLFTKKVLQDLTEQKIFALKKEECTGCGACKQICHKNAISMCSDEEGFWYPKLDMEACVSCGNCEQVCPVAKAEKKKSAMQKVYAAWSLQEEIRQESTSGGIFSELALQFLREGGKIYGAAYNEQFQVGHMGIENAKGLERLRQSKYVQSDLKNVFHEIKEEIKTGRRVLFCGTPCQCEALKHFLELHKLNRQSVLLVDFICRGSNSPKVYQLFLQELEQQYHSRIKRVWFKNKTYGWNNFSTKIEFENGKSYLKTREEDPYIRGYIIKNLYIRPSCMHCVFKGTDRAADITLADFWGISLGERQEDTDKGTSMVLIHTQQGEDLFQAVKENIFYEEKRIADVLPGNACLMKSAEEGEHRKEFLKDLDNLGFFRNIERFL